MKPEFMSEKEKKIAEADKVKQDRFMGMYNDCHLRFSRFCRAMSRNDNDARDLHSETILKAYENFEQIRKPDSFLYYLFGMATRIHRNKLRRQKFSGFFKQEQADNIIDHSGNPDEKLEVVLLFEAMQKLPAAQREALALFEISGLTLKEIQAIQDCSLSAVKARISRARQKLAQLLFVDEKDLDAAKPENAGQILAEKLKTMTVNFF